MRGLQSFSPSSVLSTISTMKTNLTISKRDNKLNSPWFPIMPIKVGEGREKEKEKERGGKGKEKTEKMRKRGKEVAGRKQGKGGNERDEK